VEEKRGAKIEIAVEQGGGKPYNLQGIERQNTPTKEKGKKIKVKVRSYLTAAEGESIFRVGEI